MWKCKECGNVIFRKDHIVRGYVILDKNGNVRQDTKPVELIERIICDECGSYSDNIVDIAEWEED